MKSESEIRTELLKRAAADEAFRARLVADPRGVVESEFGVTVPDSFSLHVHEETADSAHLVLPPKGGRLTPDELQAVAGAHGGTGVRHDAQPTHWGT